MEKNYVIYPVNYTELSTTTKNNYAEFSFNVDGVEVKTLKSVTFKLQYGYGLSLWIDKIIDKKVKIKIDNPNYTDAPYYHEGLRTEWVAELLSNDGKELDGVKLNISAHKDERNNGVVIKYTIENETEIRKTVKLGINKFLNDVHLKKDGVNKVKITDEGYKDFSFILEINNFDRNNPGINTLWTGKKDNREDWEGSDAEHVMGDEMELFFSWQGIEIPAGGSVERSFSVSLFCKY